MDHLWSLSNKLGMILYTNDLDAIEPLTGTNFANDASALVFTQPII